MSSRGRGGPRFSLILALPGALALFAAAGAAQTSSPAPAKPPATREFRLEVARRVMTAARYASLVTVATDGRAQARIVDPLLPGPSMEVYFATNPRTRKVAEIARDPRVTMLYFDPASMAYVTLIGEAAPVPASERGAHYKSDWAGFFPRANPEAWLLYRVRPILLEIVSAADGLSGDRLTWHPDSVSVR